MGFEGGGRSVPGSLVARRQPASVLQPSSLPYSTFSPDSSVVISATVVGYIPLYFPLLTQFCAPPPSFAVI